MTPEEIIEALRFAIASGAIQLHTYVTYPTDPQLFYKDGILGIKFMSAEIYFQPQGVPYDRPL